MENSSPPGSSEAKTEAATESELAQLQSIILAKRALSPHREIPALAEQLKRLPSTPSQTDPSQLPRPESIDAEEIRRRSRRSTLIQDSGIPRRHLMLSREQKPSERQDKAIRRIVDSLGRGGLFALLGPRGGGKTQVAAWVIQNAADREIRSLFTTAQDMYRCLRTAFRSDGTTEAQTLGRFKTPALLVIDEMNERAETAFEDRSLGDILNHRYNEMRDTILISNHQPEEFKRQMGISVMDRLHETGTIIECTWPSFRDKAVR